LFSLELFRAEGAGVADARAEPLNGAREQNLDGAQGLSSEFVRRHGLLPQAECCIAQCFGARPEAMPLSAKGLRS
jgi:hypothetical protein